MCMLSLTLLILNAHRKWSTWLMIRILCRIFFLLRKACMYGTKTRSSSKRSLKGTMTAILCRPHEESSTGAVCLSKGHGWWGGRSTNCGWFRSAEQLSCSQRREQRTSTTQRLNSFSTEHFLHRNLKQTKKKKKKKKKWTADNNRKMFSLKIKNLVKRTG